MAKINYSSSSPYAQTDSFGNFLDVMVDRPITAKEAHVLLSSLLPELTEDQIKERAEAFVKASQWITDVSNAGGIPGSKKMTFQSESHRKNKDNIRVDIEVNGKINLVKP